MKIYRISQSVSGNRDIPSEYLPTRQSLIHSAVRLVNQMGSANKHYIICVYETVGNNTLATMYPVIAYNGRIGGTLQSQPKGYYNSALGAMRHARDIAWEKRNGRDPYQLDDATTINQAFISRHGIIGTLTNAAHTQSAPRPIPPISPTMSPPQSQSTKSPSSPQPEDISSPLFPNGLPPLESWSDSFVSRTLFMLNKIGSGVKQRSDKNLIEQFIHQAFNSRFWTDTLVQLDYAFFQNINMTSLNKQKVLNHYFPMPEAEGITLKDKPKRSLRNLLGNTTK